jgi:hypothetical protein
LSYAVILSEAKDPRISLLPLPVSAVLSKGKDPDTLNITQTLKPFLTSNPTPLAQRIPKDKKTPKNPAKTLVKPQNHINQSF